MDNHYLAFDGATGSAEKPVWSRIDADLEYVEVHGGQATLNRVRPVEDANYAYLGYLWMDGLPSKFRLIYQPHENPTEKSNDVEWWEPDGAPFRGWTVSQHGDPWDDRTYCRDINVAKAIFREYFDTMELSAETLKQFHSGWDRISGGHGNPEPHP